LLGALPVSHSWAGPAGKKKGSAVKKNKPSADYRKYTDFFEEVYKSFSENYYKPVSRESFDAFLWVFQSKIYSQLLRENKSDDFVRWRSAALLVERLRDPEDIFSAFYPPKPAKKYEGEALAKTVEIEERMELGIRTRPVPQGHVVDFVEPRSGAYEKGLRDNDLIARIDEKETSGLSADQVKDLLNPRSDAVVLIDYFSHLDRRPRRISVEPKEFFKQMIFPVDTRVPGVYGLRVERFNRMTGQDMFRFLELFRRQGEIRGLIIDLRDNPGGPPLAAREIASFFLTPGDKFADFKKRGEVIAGLDVPEIPEQYRYTGPLVILVNRQSGSASELFSGILQRRGRAVLMGDYTAGQVMLKSMFYFDDESMLLLITARGHHPDGQVFSFQGIRPDRRVEPDENIDLVQYAQKYFLFMDPKGPEPRSSQGE
jgi:C-terminal peptidase prc